MNNELIFSTAETYAHSMIARLGTEICMTEDAHKQREEALDALPELLANCDAKRLPMVDMVAAYMMCSYGFTHRKHEIKPYIVDAFRQAINGNGTNDGIAEPKRTGTRPHAIIIGTWFKSNHSVFRWFGKSIEGMRRHFQTTGIIFTPYDDDAAKVFDKAYCVPAQPAPVAVQLVRLCELIRSLGPDVIVFVDNAMHPFGIGLSAMRLAPLQVLMCGHPSSSYSPEIDYFLTDEGHAPGLHDFSERPAVVPESAFACTAPEFWQIPKYTRGSGPVRIVVPGVRPKLTYPFLRACNQIMEALPSEIELHVMTNCDAHEKDTITALIQNVVPKAQVYSHLTHGEYMVILDQCDMFLNPFSFSGSTTMLDCAARYLPGVTMTGPEILQSQGAYALRRCGLPPFGTVAHTEREYIANAVHMAIDRSMREDYRETLRRCFEAMHGQSLFAQRSPGFGDKLFQLYAKGEYHGTNRNAAHS